MKRLPILYTLLAVIALTVSVAYWFMALYKVPVRPMVAAPPAAVVEPSTDAGASLFGGQAVVATVSNYQLTGVVAAGRQSVAILVADGQPPKALTVGKEVATGVTVIEVHPRYVMLSEGGIQKRIDLATDAKAGPNLAPPMQMQQPDMGNNQNNNVPPGANEPPPPPPPGIPSAPGQVEMPPPTRTMNPGAPPRTM